MKFNSYYIPLAVVLCISLFFACTSELELPVSPDKVLCAYGNEKRCSSPPSDGKCRDGGELVQRCPYNSSSSGGEGNSSTGGSSSDTGGSSSSTGSSSSRGSSSSISLVVTGHFEFRNFDYHDEVEKDVYYLGTKENMYQSNDPDGHSQFFSNLEITNAPADCSPIKIEVDGLGDLTEMPTVTDEYPTISEPGIITATAVVNCASGRVVLKRAFATVVPDPTFECKLPSIYVYRNETIKNLVTTVENNYGRCTDTDIRYSPDHYPSSASTTPTQFTVNVSCGPSITSPCSELTIDAVASNYIKFNAAKRDTSVSTGSTVMELPIDGVKFPHKIQCESNSVKFSFYVNKDPVTTDENWVQAPLDSAQYLHNGNRILFETGQGTIRTCKLEVP